MSQRRKITVDGNEAAASVAHRTNEVIAIYPITPSSNMGEWADEWSAQGKKNVWGVIPDVVEMQSEGGAAGSVHGALQAGALTTTFTASQGLLLMIPNMYKIAGELCPHVMHVTARAVASHALSIFGDHTDVMACRQTGFAMLGSASVQEVHDMAIIAQRATLKSRVPILHFFDGFRTSHEVAKIEELTNDDLLAMLDPADIRAHRERALSPDRPKVRGTAQNPDVFFQAREACNPFYDACPEAIQEAMDKFATVTGRQYKLFEYYGAPDAESIVVLMGSAAETAQDTIEWMVAKGQKVGMVKVHLYRPFSLKHLLQVLPASVKTISVLDRTKEPGAFGEPLYLDIVSSLNEAVGEGIAPFKALPRILSGRFGLSSKEFTPAHIKSVLDNAAQPKPKNHFTVGINDDVTNLSLEWDHSFAVEGPEVHRAVFFGLGADGTVGANKNSIKIIGEETDFHAQGYFVYDSKKSGAITISHLRFGPNPIRSAYLISQASFVGCHQFLFLEKYDVLAYAAPGAVFLLNAPYSADQVFDHLPKEVQEQIIKKNIKFYTIDAYEVANKTGMGQRINTIMQTCFFAISGVLPRDEAISQIKKAIKKTYGRKGEDVVKANYEAVDETLAHLHEVKVPSATTSAIMRPPVVSEHAPDFVRNITAVMMANKGDTLPVSAFVADGTWPTATTQWEKRNVAQEIPVWNSALCIQCNKCAILCPHAAVRPKVFAPEHLEKAPATFKSCDYKGKDFPGQKFAMQVAPEDCTGCGVCVGVCPAKDKADPRKRALTMQPQLPLREAERENYAFFLALPEVDRTKLDKIDVKTSQFMRPLFEYSGACGGCGETPYVKLLTQLFGDRALIANATGCSSIYGGNLPTTPYCVDENGRGPSWANSLFEDNAEYGFGFRLAVDQNKNLAKHLLKKFAPVLGDDLVTGLLEGDQYTEKGVFEQRQRVELLRDKLAADSSAEAKALSQLGDYLVRKSVWMVGGDGWAYDIGYGGLDHVLANTRDVNLLVLDTEVYSNTGGQASKATPLGAAAKFAASGKAVHKKDLGLMAMAYGHVYVASVAMGARDLHTVKAFQEADSYDGPSLIIAYSHCIAHGYDLAKGPEQQKLAVETGMWPLYRFDPRRLSKGEAPLVMEAWPPKGRVVDFMRNETRFKMVEKMDSERFQLLGRLAQDFSSRRVELYDYLAKLSLSKPGTTH